MAITDWVIVIGVPAAVLAALLRSVYLEGKDGK